jgi:hypothetical protein
MASIGMGEAAGVAQHMRGALKSRPASVPARSTIFAKPAAESGTRRSFTNTNDDAGRDALKFVGNWPEAEATSNGRGGCLVGYYGHGALLIEIAGSSSAMTSLGA